MQHPAFNPQHAQMLLARGMLNGAAHRGVVGPPPGGAMFRPGGPNPALLPGGDHHGNLTPGRMRGPVPGTVIRQQGPRLPSYQPPPLPTQSHLNGMTVSSSLSSSSISSSSSSSSSSQGSRPVPASSRSHDTIQRIPHIAAQAGNLPEATLGRIDSASVSGKFGWTSIDGVEIPFLLREEKKYLAVRMVEMKLLSKYPSTYPEELKKRPPLMSHYITEYEARLLNEINAHHCNGEYGSQPFITQHLIVKMSDFEEFYNIVKKHFPPNVLARLPHMMGPGQPPEKVVDGGWIQVNNTVVPFVYRSKLKYVPLSVIRYAAGLLTDVRVEGNPLKEEEWNYFNESCRGAGVEFTFAKTAKLVMLDVVQQLCNNSVTISELPKDDPFSQAQYHGDEERDEGPANNTSSMSLSTSQMPYLANTASGRGPVNGPSPPSVASATQPSPPGGNVPYWMNHHLGIYPGVTSAPGAYPGGSPHLIRGPGRPPLGQALPPQASPHLSQNQQTATRPGSTHISPPANISQPKSGSASEVNNNFSSGQRRASHEAMDLTRDLISPRERKDPASNNSTPGGTPLGRSLSSSSLSQGTTQTPRTSSAGSGSGMHRTTPDGSPQGMIPSAPGGMMSGIPPSLHPSLHIGPDGHPVLGNMVPPGHPGWHSMMGNPAEYHKMVQIMQLQAMAQQHQHQQQQLQQQLQMLEQQHMQQQRFKQHEAIVKATRGSPKDIPRSSTVQHLPQGRTLSTNSSTSQKSPSPSMHHPSIPHAGPKIHNTPPPPAPPLAAQVTKPSLNQAVIQRVEFQGKTLSCIVKGERKEHYALVEALSRVYFPNCTLEEFQFALENVLQVPLVQLTQEEERSFISFYNIPTKTLMCNKVIRLTEFQEHIPKLRYMFKDKLPGNLADKVQDPGASRGTVLVDAKTEGTKLPSSFAKDLPSNSSTFNTEALGKKVSAALKAVMGKRPASNDGESDSRDSPGPAKQARASLEEAVNRLKQFQAEQKSRRKSTRPERMIGSQSPTSDTPTEYQARSPEPESGKADSVADGNPTPASDTAPAAAIAESAVEKAGELPITDKPEGMSTDAAQSVIMAATSVRSEEAMETEVTLSESTAVQEEEKQMVASTDKQALSSEQSVFTVSGTVNAEPEAIGSDITNPAAVDTLANTASAEPNLIPADSEMPTVTDSQSGPDSMKPSVSYIDSAAASGTEAVTTDFTPPLTTESLSPESPSEITKHTDRSTVPNLTAVTPQEAVSVEGTVESSDSQPAVDSDVLTDRGCDLTVGEAVKDTSHVTNADYTTANQISTGATDIDNSDNSPKMVAECDKVEESAIDLSPVKPIEKSEVGRDGEESIVIKDSATESTSLTEGTASQDHSAPMDFSNKNQDHQVTPSSGVETEIQSLQLPEEPDSQLTHESMREEAEIQNKMEEEVSDQSWITTQPETAPDDLLLACTSITSSVTTPTSASENSQSLDLSTKALVCGGERAEDSKDDETKPEDSVIDFSNTSQIESIVIEKQSQLTVDDVQNISQKESTEENEEKQEDEKKGLNKTENETSSGETDLAIISVITPGDSQQHVPQAYHIDQDEEGTQDEEEGLSGTQSDLMEESSFFGERLSSSHADRETGSRILSSEEMNTQPANQVQPVSEAHRTLAVPTIALSETSGVGEKEEEEDVEPPMEAIDEDKEKQMKDMCVTVTKTSPETSGDSEMREGDMVCNPSLTMEGASGTGEFSQVPEPPQSQPDLSQCQSDPPPTQPDSPSTQIDPSTSLPEPPSSQYNNDLSLAGPPPSHLDLASSMPDTHQSHPSPDASGNMPNVTPTSLPDPPPSMPDTTSDNPNPPSSKLDPPASMSDNILSSPDNPQVLPDPLPNQPSPIPSDTDPLPSHPSPPRNQPSPLPSHPAHPLPGHSDPSQNHPHPPSSHPASLPDSLPLEGETKEPDPKDGSVGICSSDMASSELDSCKEKSEETMEIESEQCTGALNMECGMGEEESPREELWGGVEEEESHINNTDIIPPDTVGQSKVGLVTGLKSSDQLEIASFVMDESPGSDDIGLDDNYFNGDSPKENKNEEEEVLGEMEVDGQDKKEDENKSKVDFTSEESFSTPLTPVASKDIASADKAESCHRDMSAFVAPKDQSENPGTGETTSIEKAESWGKNEAAGPQQAKIDNLEDVEMPDEKASQNSLYTSNTINQNTFVDSTLCKRSNSDSDGAVDSTLTTSAVRVTPSVTADMGNLHQAGSIMRPSLCQEVEAVPLTGSVSVAAGETTSSPAGEESNHEGIDSMTESEPLGLEMEVDEVEEGEEGEMSVPDESTEITPMPAAFIGLFPGLDDDESETDVSFSNMEEKNETIYPTNLEENQENEEVFTPQNVGEETPEAADVSTPVVSLVDSDSGSAGEIESVSIGRNDSSQMVIASGEIVPPEDKDQEKSLDDTNSEQNNAQEQEGLSLIANTSQAFDPSPQSGNQTELLTPTETHLLSVPEVAPLDPPSSSCHPGQPVSVVDGDGEKQEEEKEEEAQTPCFTPESETSLHCGESRENAASVQAAPSESESNIPSVLEPQSASPSSLNQGMTETDLEKEAELSEHS